MPRHSLNSVLQAVLREHVDEVVVHSILKEDDHRFWEENGYLVIPNVVPEPLRNGVVGAIWDHLGVEGDQPQDWHRVSPGGGDESAALITRGGGVRISSHHQALWDTRQYAPIHQIFTEILGTEKLWVSFDRVNMKPPVHPDHPEWESDGLSVHWDLNVEKLTAVPLTVQGILYLTDTDEDQGGFRCVPGFHRRFDRWRQTLPPGGNAGRPPFEKVDLAPIPGKAGDFLVWHRLTPHANGRNESDRPRMAQYITMFSAPESNERLRQERIASWRDDTPIRSTKSQEFDIPGDDLPEPTHSWDTHRNHPPELTTLGRRLAGLDLWP
jgi:hypothetical protein